MTSGSGTLAVETARSRGPSHLSRDTEPAAAGSFDVWRHRFAVFTACATLFLIFAGGLVTSTQSGLSVPDWPLSYGMLMPPMVGGVFYEHGHRMVATTVGFLTLVFAVWTAARESRRGVRRLAWLALAMVVTQGILGGLTVIYLLPAPISIAHACLAQTFFCVTIALAYVTSREWLAARPEASSDTRALQLRAAIAAAAAVYLQLAIGAVMRHIGAGLAIPDVPLAFGRLIPPFDSAAIAVHFAHRMAGLAVLAITCVAAWRARGGSLGRFAALPVALSVVQIGLGIWAVASSKAVYVTTAHVANGAAILGIAWLLVLRTFRLGGAAAGLRPSPGGVAA